MATDPQYVKLSHKASRGMLVDLDMGSGFSISGRDVKEFPSDLPSKKYVRRELKRGNIVVASAAEFEEAKDGDEAIPSDTELPHQEHRIREALAQAKQSGTPDSEASSSSGSSDDGGEKSKGKKGKSKKKDKSEKSKEKKEKGDGDAYTRDELAELGQDDLKALLEANPEATFEGRFSKAKAVDSLIEAGAVKK